MQYLLKQLVAMVGVPQLVLLVWSNFGHPFLAKAAKKTATTFDDAALAVLDKTLRGMFGEASAVASAQESGISQATVAQAAPSKRHGKKAKHARAAA